MGCKICTIDFDNATIQCGTREFKILQLFVQESKIRLKDIDELHGGELCHHISVFFGDNGLEIFKQLIDEFYEYVVYFLELHS